MLPASRHTLRLEPHGDVDLNYAWPQAINDALAARIIGLIRKTTRLTPIVGFGTAVEDAQAQAYIDDLRAHLSAGKLHLLAVTKDNGELVGQCLLRRNLNPNNRHIADIAKGMVDDTYRAGGLLLSVAFLEITRLCAREGIELLTLDVRAGTRAQRIWERFGFVTYGVLNDYARVDGRSLAGRYMSQPVTGLRERARRIAARAGLALQEEASA